MTKVYHDSTEPAGPLLKNRTYDWLKQIATLVLPGLGTLYFTLAQIWGLPNAEEVVGTIAAVNVFVGLLIGLSTRVYNHSESRFDGTIDVLHNDEALKQYSLNLNSDPEDLDKKDQVIFKVNKE